MAGGHSSTMPATVLRGHTTEKQTGFRDRGDWFLGCLSPLKQGLPQTGISMCSQLAAGFLLPATQNVLVGRKDAEDNQEDGGAKIQCGRLLALVLGEISTLRLCPLLPSLDSGPAH